jgi:hypothetical protein
MQDILGVRSFRFLYERVGYHEANSRPKIEY